MLISQSVLGSKGKSDLTKDRNHTFIFHLNFINPKFFKEFLKIVYYISYSTKNTRYIWRKVNVILNNTKYHQ